MNHDTTLLQATQLIYKYQVDDLPWGAFGLVSMTGCSTIAHCVSADVLHAKWGSKGVAAAIIDMFCIRDACKRMVGGVRNKAFAKLDGQLPVGSLLVVNGKWQGVGWRILNLITKDKFNSKPNRMGLVGAFRNMACYLANERCFTVAMPLLACGRDGQVWSTRVGHPGGTGVGRYGTVCVQELLEECFGDQPCTLHVFHQLQTCYGRDTCERTVRVNEQCCLTKMTVKLVNG